jgi:hypothetical protein
MDGRRRRLGEIEQGPVVQWPRTPASQAGNADSNSVGATWLRLRPWKPLPRKGRADTCEAVPTRRRLCPQCADLSAGPSTTARGSQSDCRCGYRSGGVPPRRAKVIDRGAWPSQNDASPRVSYRLLSAEVRAELARSGTVIEKAEAEGRLDRLVCSEVAVCGQSSVVGRTNAVGVRPAIAIRHRAKGSLAGRKEVEGPFSSPEEAEQMAMAQTSGLAGIGTGDDRAWFPLRLRPQQGVAVSEPALVVGSAPASGDRIPLTVF